MKIVKVFNKEGDILYMRNDGGELLPPLFWK